MLELFETVEPSVQQTQLIERIIQVSNQLTVHDCIVDAGFDHSMVGWQELEPSSTAAANLLRTLWSERPFGRWYSSVDEDFVSSRGLGIEMTFLRSIVDQDGPTSSFVVRQFSENDRFASQSAAHFDALSRCSDTISDATHADLEPEVVSTLRGELDEAVMALISGETDMFGGYRVCMKDMEFDFAGPGSAFEHLMFVSGGDPYPASGVPGVSQDSSNWEEAARLEREIAVADAECRRAYLEQIDERLLQIAREFEARNAEALLELPAAWDSLQVRAAALLPVG